MSSLPEPLRPSVSPQLRSARIILVVVSLSYLLSAGLLIAARGAGQPVPAWFVLGWAVCGLAGSALSRHLPPGITPAWWAVAAVLLPWMLLSLVVDVRIGNLWIAALDLAGLAAIGYALSLAATARRDPLATTSN